MADASQSKAPGRREARALRDEARWLLRRAGEDVSAKARAEVEATIAEVEEGLRARDAEGLGSAARRLGALIEQHLAFARKGKIREFAESIGLALAIALVLRAFVIEAFQIPSGSMEPTLLIGDRLFVAKYSMGVRVPFSTRYLTRWGEPETGDVVVFVFPGEEVRTQMHLSRTAHALREHAHREGAPPQSLEELLNPSEALAVRPEHLRDGWGEPLRYEREEDGFSLWSAGRDGVPGTASDWHADESAFTGTNFACVDGESVDGNKDYIKRIIGVGGDEIAMRDNRWYVNDSPIERETLGPVRPDPRSRAARMAAEERLADGRAWRTHYAQIQPDFGPVTVRPDHFFAVGDNRDFSSDSRCWGQVPVEHIKGRALFLFFSAGPEGIRWERIFSRIR